MAHSDGARPFQRMSLILYVLAEVPCTHITSNADKHVSTGAIVSRCVVPLRTFAINPLKPFKGCIKGMMA
jgi:hypothetical protein